MITAIDIANAFGGGPYQLFHEPDTGVRTEPPLSAAHQALLVKAWPNGELNPVPQEVGSGQIRAALVALGWITIQNPSNADAEVDAWGAGLIELAVSDPAQKTIAHLFWRNASGFKRENQFILLVATILGKTGEETDQLFRVAATF